MIQKLVHEEPKWVMLLGAKLSYLEYNILCKPYKVQAPKSIIISLHYGLIGTPLSMIFFTAGISSMPFSHAANLGNFAVSKSLFKEDSEKMA